jgi:hypothetical protein
LAYNKFFNPKPPDLPQSKLAAYIEQMKEINLWYIDTQSGIFKSRFVTKYIFKADVMFEIPRLEICVDENQDIIGSYVVWDAYADSGNDRLIDSIEIPKELRGWGWRTDRIFAGFIDITDNFDFKSFKKCSWEPDPLRAADKGEYKYLTHKQWTITFSKTIDRRGREAGLQI